MLQHGVKIDFVSCEMKWYEDDIRKVVPFWCTNGKRGGRPAKVRMARRARVRTGTCHNVELAVTARKGCSRPRYTVSRISYWGRR